MRLTKKMEEVATAELLEILGRYPNRSTSDLSSTPKFHGERTLSNRQIIRLLNASGRAQSTLSGYGNRTYFVWTLKPTDTDGQADTTEKIESVCEHGKKTTLDIQLPLTVEVIDCSEEQDGSEHVAWLKSGEKWFVVTVSEPGHRRERVDFVAKAFRALLESDAGQQSALAYIRHEFAGGGLA